MRTKKDIEYKAAPYGYIATIPAGTAVHDADNLPARQGSQARYWACAWVGMTDKAKAWMDGGYGFLLEEWEVLELPDDE